MKKISKLVVMCLMTLSIAAAPLASSQALAGRNDEPCTECKATWTQWVTQGVGILMLEKFAASNLPWLQGINDAVYKIAAGASKAAMDGMKARWAARRGNGKKVE